MVTAADAEIGQEISIPQSVLGRLLKSEDLRSIRDRMFNLAKDLLSAWLKARGSAPEWMGDRVTHVHAWGSPGRMVTLLNLWKEQPEAAEPVYAWLTHWYHRNRHLWQWEAGARRKALLHRREEFRKAAAKLAETYETLVIEKLDLSKLARRALPEAVDNMTKASRYQRTVTSPSELRQVLVNAFRTRGGKVVEVACAYTTADCSWCSHRNTWESTEALLQTCDGCGRTWDQDLNAARNLWHEVDLGGGTEKLVSTKPGRGAKLAEAKSKKMRLAAEAAEVAEAATVRFETAVVDAVAAGCGG